MKNYTRGRKRVPISRKYLTVKTIFYFLIVKRFISLTTYSNLVTK